MINTEVSNLIGEKTELTNGQIFRRTFVFSWWRFLIDLLALIVLAALTAGGYFISGKQLLGLGIGAVVGLIVFGLIVHFLTYLLKAGQIAMMTRGVTEGDLPDKVFDEGKREVKERFLTVSAYFFVTSAIQGIFRQISRGLTALGNLAGGDVGGGIGSVIGIAINTVVAYLGNCCLGWVFYRKSEGAFKSTCEGAVLFFKNWKTLLRNLGRIFGMGIASFVVIGGAFAAIGYAILSQFPQIFKDVAITLENSDGTTSNISDPTTAIIICSIVVAVILWAILHNAFVRPFVLVGVLRNYMAAGIANMPEEGSFSKLDSISSKFAKMHEKARTETGTASPAAAG